MLCWMLGKRDAEATPIDVAGKTPDGVLAVFPEGIPAGSHQRLVYSQDHEVIAAPSGDILSDIPRIGAITARRFCCEHFSLCPPFSPPPSSCVGWADWGILLIVAVLCHKHWLLVCSAGIRNLQSCFLRLTGFPQGAGILARPSGVTPIKIHGVSVMPRRMQPLDALAWCFSYCQLASRWKRNWVSSALVPSAPDRVWDCSQISGGETFESADG